MTDRERTNRYHRRRRPQRAAMPVPPSIMVGIKEGQSAAEVRAAINAID